MPEDTATGMSIVFTKLDELLLATNQQNVEIKEIKECLLGTLKNPESGLAHRVDSLEKRSIKVNKLKKLIVNGLVGIGFTTAGLALAKWWHLS